LLEPDAFARAYSIMMGRQGPILMYDAGAVARRFAAEELKFPYGDEEATKVSIGVKPNARDQGVGEKLMR